MRATSTARIAAAVVLAALAGSAAAHELRPACLDLTEIEAGRIRVLWRKPTVGEAVPYLAPQFPPSWKPVGTPRTSQTPESAVVRAVYDTGGPLRGQTVAIDGLSATATDVLVRITFSDGSTRTRVLKPDAPAFVVEEGSAGSASAYFGLGMQHILLGVDHLLFVLGLLVIVGRRWGMLLKTVTAFTVAHSLALAAAHLDWVAVPAGPLNAVIALSILFLGVEIVRMRRGETSLTIRHPWAAAFGFGLVHGLGFASGLSTLGLPPREVLAALFLFNVGVEAGQLVFVGLYFAVGRSLRRLEVPEPRWAGAIPGDVVGCLGGYWTIAQLAALVGGRA